MKNSRYDEIMDVDSIYLSVSNEEKLENKGGDPVPTQLCAPSVFCTPNTSSQACVPSSNSGGHCEDDLN